MGSRVVPQAVSTIKRFNVISVMIKIAFESVASMSDNGDRVQGRINASDLSPRD